MHDLLIRCSSVGKIMTEPKSKSAGPLSEGAKTYIRSLAAQDIFGVDFEFSSKETEKGILVEDDAIGLLNRVRGLNLSKNGERRKDDWLSGECDLFNAPKRRGHDLKCPWSIQTFPLTSADCEDKLYEWQMRGYMRLWDADEWEVNYALLSTPERLIRYEPSSMHFVDHVPEHLRLTSWTITRDTRLENLMIEKIKAARDYYAEVMYQFDREHPADLAALVAPAFTQVDIPNPTHFATGALLPELF